MFSKLHNCNKAKYTITLCCCLESDISYLLALIEQLFFSLIHNPKKNDETIITCTCVTTTLTHVDLSSCNGPNKVLRLLSPEWPKNVVVLQKGYSRSLLNVCRKFELSPALLSTFHPLHGNAFILCPPNNVGFRCFFRQFGAHA